MDLGIFGSKSTKCLYFYVWCEVVFERDQKRSGRQILHFRKLRRVPARWDSAAPSPALGRVSPAGTGTGRMVSDCIILRLLCHFSGPLSGRLILLTLSPFLLPFFALL